jgi:hypothetical protein
MRTDNCCSANNTHLNQDVSRSLGNLNAHFCDAAQKATGGLPRAHVLAAVLMIAVLVRSAPLARKRSGAALRYCGLRREFSCACASTTNPNRKLISVDVHVELRPCRHRRDIDMVVVRSDRRAHP